MQPIPIWLITDEHLKSKQLVGYGVYGREGKPSWCWFKVANGRFVNNQINPFHPSHYFPQQELLTDWLNYGN